MPITLGSNTLSLRVQTHLNQSGQRLADTYQRLSSGQRINKASDDAASLAIAERLNSDARVSNVAIRNVNDAISVLNILDSALGSQKEILMRLGELAEQSANGIYGQEERKNLNGEYQALMQEFDRIADSTEFNGQKLIRKTDDADQFHIMVGTTGDEISLLSLDKANSHIYSGTVALRADFNNDGGVSIFDLPQLIDGTKPDSFYDESYSDEELEHIQYTAQVNFTDSEGETGTLRFYLVRWDSDFGLSNSNLDEQPAALDLFGLAERDDGDTATITQLSYITPSNTELVINGSYATSGATFGITLDLSDIEYKTLELGDVQQSAIGFTNIESKESSRVALDTVTNRIDELNQLLGSYGALQGRLDSAKSVLSVSRENFKAAESQIRDTDIAQETADLVRTSIQQQAGAAILRQANIQPEIALQLLS